ncbi:sigma 54-interacting transcriptional regulator [Oligoflexaceae bacterium]|nr:sigma 54-interacting transcriptional regulator [Oligoflexaceae bacterium]
MKHDQKIILHVEDDPFEREAVRSIVSAEIPDVLWQTKADFSAARRFIKSLTKPVSLMIVDLDLGSPRSNGIELLSLYKEKFAKSPVLVRTNFDDGEHLEAVLNAKADSICIKGIDDHLLSRLCLSFINDNKSEDIGKLARWPSAVFPTKELEDWRQRLPQILKSAISHIHLFGPSGSGKEVYADLLQLTLPPEVPFVRVNCAAVSPGIFASEFYGHVKGSFTGASKDRPGYLSRADGGWLFLDEVQCLSLEAQASLLRAMESGEFIPVGSDRPIKLKVKVLSAANENIAQLVEDDLFRLDLEQRLCEIKVSLQGMAALDSKQERLDLIHHIAEQLEGGPYQVTPSCASKLAERSWSRGHFRELRNTMRAMTEHQRDGILSATSIPVNCVGSSLRKTSASVSETFESSVQKMMVQNIKSIAEENPGISLRKMADKLSISRSTLVRKIQSAHQSGLISAELADRLPTTLEA